MQHRIVVTDKGAKRLKQPAGTEIAVGGARAVLYKRKGWAMEAPAKAAAAPAATTPSPDAEQDRAPPTETSVSVETHETPTRDIDDLREQFERQFGRAADRRWGAERLRQELSAGTTYERRDMWARSDG